MPTLNELADLIHKQAKKNGFHDKERRLPEILMLASSELGEAFEAWRKNPDALDGSYYEKEGKPEGWGVEIIDCIIVCLDMLAANGIDVDFVMGKKLEYNMTREIRHGKHI